MSGERISTGRTLCTTAAYAAIACAACIPVGTHAQPALGLSQAAQAAPLVQAEAPAASAPSARVPTAIAAAAAGGHAPTIDALSAAQRRELEQEVARKLTAVLGAGQPAAPAAAPAAPAASAVILRPPVVEVAAPPDTTKRILAIYGPVGNEIADIQLPNGTVTTVRAGGAIHGFQVQRITAQTVELVAVGPERLGGATVRKAVSRTERPVTQGSPTREQHAAVAAPTRDSQAKIIRVAVGGTFK